MKPCIEKIEFHGLPALRLHGPNKTQAVVSLLGGQLLSWLTSDGRERLYLSEQAVFDGSVAIRGGVPVCFPQFAALGDLPKHGFVRTRPWTASSERCGDDYALVSLEISDDDATRAIWPHAFRCELTVMLEADRIDLELCVLNTGEAEFAFSGALHTYLRVVQVEDVTLEGLYGHDYRDAANDNVVIRETGTHLAVDREIDRVYRNIKRPQLLQAGNLSLALQNQGFPDVVVWNPWVDKCAALADLPADGWRRMLCVEAAIAERPVSLAAGDEWYGRQTLVAV
ncbi:MAG: D-hexose-6-phosphate mutarotase [Rhodocyclaceae bacterium]|nr:D-hexose-6-phosphate mutarotase [Rhodocyclaceae bacterium]